jgi:hypothetical protein
MSLAEEIKRLEDLRWNGTLTDEEFARAKAALLAKLEQPGDAKSESGGAVAAQLAEVRYQNELERIDREWQIEKEKYMVADKYGRRHIPTAGAGKGIALVGGVFGTFWTIMALSITSGAPDFGPFMIAKLFFPLFGVAFTVGAIWGGMHMVKKAKAYDEAFAAYQKRRAAVKAADFR